ncbi:hypothetical protein KIPB_004893 [Kipferlia bialata]|uniref:Uncharacterized protein n=1 Tax=Kipferlia bialata TaxID=797122 RepID=A0A9K3GII8_9EUKA|nr:hypothetical protein KIPB_004893 [Kipferlia bialata]|eukprot:g4893.t1
MSVLDGALIARLTQVLYTDHSRNDDRLTCEEFESTVSDLKEYTSHMGAVCEAIHTGKRCLSRDYSDIFEDPEFIMAGSVERVRMLAECGLLGEMVTMNTCE